VYAEVVIVCGVLMVTDGYQALINEILAQHVPQGRGISDRRV